MDVCPPRPRVACSQRTRGTHTGRCTPLVGGKWKIWLPGTPRGPLPLPAGPRPRAGNADFPRGPRGAWLGRPWAHMPLPLLRAPGRPRACSAAVPEPQATVVWAWGWFPGGRAPEHGGPPSWAPPAQAQRLPLTLKLPAGWRESTGREGGEVSWGLRLSWAQGLPQGEPRELQHRLESKHPHTACGWQQLGPCSERPCVQPGNKSAWTWVCRGSWKDLVSGG